MPSGLAKIAQQQVGEGKTSALVVMKFLVTVARVSMEDCERMAAAFAQHHCDTGQERRCVTCGVGLEPTTLRLTATQLVVHTRCY